jgi:hypothetical protein
VEFLLRDVQTVMDDHFSNHFIIKFEFHYILKEDSH